MIHQNKDYIVHSITLKEMRNNMLQKSIFNNMLSLTSSKIFLALSLYPFLYLITLFLPTNFMQIGGIDNGLSGLDFYYGIVIAQSQFAIPLIMMSYFVSKLFYEEHNTGKLIIYKDIKRSRLLNAKLHTLLSFYGLYLILLFISSEILYFSFIKNFNYASGSFLPADKTIIYNDLLNIIGLFEISFIAIFFAILLSMRFSSGFTILGVILLFMIISIAPLIKGMQYIFPNSYNNVVDLNDFFIKLFFQFL